MGFPPTRIQSNFLFEIFKKIFAHFVLLRIMRFLITTMKNLCEKPIVTNSQVNSKLVVSILCTTMTIYSLHLTAILYSSIYIIFITFLEMIIHLILLKDHSFVCYVWCFRNDEAGIGKIVHFCENKLFFNILMRDDQVIPLKQYDLYSNKITPKLRHARTLRVTSSNTGI
jgi:hypothetical protein